MIFFSFFFVFLFQKSWSVHFCAEPTNYCVQENDDLQSVINTVSAGDTIYLREGTHNSIVIVNNSNALQNNRIKIEAYPGEDVILQDDACIAGTPSFQILQPYWTINSGLGKLSFKKSCGDISPLIEIRAGFVHILGSDTTFFGSTIPLMILCESDDCDGIIIDSITFNVTSNVAIQVKMEDASQQTASGDFNRLRITNNKFVGRVQSSVLLDHVNHVSFNGNEFFEDFQVSAIKNVHNNSDCSYIKIENNIFICDSENLLSSDLGTHAQRISDFHFQNNLIVTNSNPFSDFVFRFIGENGDLSNIFIQNNLFYSNTDKNFYVSFSPSMNITDAFFRWNRQIDIVQQLNNSAGDWVVKNNTNSDNFYTIFFGSSGKNVPYYHLSANVLGYYFSGVSPIYDFNLIFDNENGVFSGRERDLIFYSQGPFNFYADIDVNGCLYNTTGGICNDCNNGIRYDVDLPKFGQCTKCVSPLFDETQSCNSCIDSLFDITQHCLECSNPKFDVETDCTTCLSENYNYSTDCEFCEGFYNESLNCQDCLMNFNLSTGCTKCNNFYDFSTDCQSCLNYFDPSTNCLQCFEGYGIASNCQNCLNENYKPSSNCSDCKDNYNISTSCTQCINNYNLTSGCTDCLDNFDVSEDCLICVLYYDISSGCTTCLPNYNESTACQSCFVENYDVTKGCVDCLDNLNISDNCESCLGNYDLASGCVDCLDNFNISDDCESCFGNYDLASGCVECLGNFNLLDDCETCANFYNFTTGCSECDRNYNISTGCTSCNKHYNLTKNCETCVSGYKESNGECVADISEELLSVESIVGLCLAGGIVFLLLGIFIVWALYQLIASKKNTKGINEGRFDAISNRTVELKEIPPEKKKEMGSSDPLEIKVSEKL